MKTAYFPESHKFRRLPLAAALFAILLSAFAVNSVAQSPQLSLADIVIALRSKKVTLFERNKILTEAVKARGVTFVMTPQLEKELTAAGADAELIGAIKVKSLPAPTPTPAATPIPTPTPPDFSFYQKRADANVGKGEFSAALVDYNKAVEMKSDDPTLFVSRGRTHFNMKSYDLSVRDYDKAVELNPKAAVAFLNRGASYEKLGDLEKALADYKKSAEIDATNETAKTEAKRLEDAIAKAKAPPVVATPVKPEFLNQGTLGTTNAVRMVTPVYSTIAQRSNIEGKVTVDVELDVEGNIVKAKATSGHAMLRSAAEEAARKSRFKPAMFDGQPIKSIGTITYNFALRGVR